ncbi:hypothetical protein WAI453_000341 [Rhynchosporium graminicola]
MSRVTRSRRFAIAEDETALASQTPLPITPAKVSVALLLEANIFMTANSFPIMHDAAAAAEVKDLKAAYKNAIDAGRKPKKGNKVNKRKDQQNNSEVTLVGDQGLENMATHGRQADATTLPPVIVNTSAAEEPPVMAPQPAMRITRNQLAKSQAAKEVWSKSPNVMDGNATIDTSLDAAADVGTLESMAEDIRCSPTPAHSPVKTLDEIETMHGPEDSGHLTDHAGEDSFVNQIICRSPAKPVSRIEDSVEALDQLEEALEALNQAAQAERMVSSEKSRQKARMPDGYLEGHKADKQPFKVSEKQATLRRQPSKSGYATVRVKTAPKQAPTLKKATSMNFKSAHNNASPVEEQKAQAPAKTAVKRPMSLLQPKEKLRSTKPPTRPIFELPGEAVALKLKEQREARMAQRQSSEDSLHTARVVSSPKIKSTKPPTKSTFELPGEELSRRKKAAHEARLKLQEEEERKRREFKARPIRNSGTANMSPRETVASRARQSKIGIESIEDGNLTTSKRGSNIGSHRLSIAALNLANMSAPRAKGAFIPPVRKPSPSAPGVVAAARPLQRTVSVTDSDLRRRAKEIYSRDARLTEEMEKEKRDREAAAKRAREEAAERGRQASREWAERQLAKRNAEGDKGMSAGYGPGGQLGLSHN